MDASYFKQILLPMPVKAEIIRALLRFVIAQQTDVPRGKEFDDRFIRESPDSPWLKSQGLADPWLSEHVARLFWVCCSLNLLKYQYPYPHKGQTYRPTRGARYVAALPTWLVTILLSGIYLGAIAAGPVKQFKRVRNIVAALTAGILWWRRHDMSLVVILYVSIIAGTLSTWVASFLASAID